MTFEDELRKASHAELVRLCAAEASLRKEVEAALREIIEALADSTPAEREKAVNIARAALR